MMKKVSFKLKSWGWSLKKQNYLVLKLGLPILLVGVVFRIYFPRSSEISPVSDISFQQTVSSSAPTPVAMSLLVDADSIPPNGTQNSNTTPDSSSLREDAKEGEGIAIENGGGKCNLFDGDWIPNPAGPVYTNETCDWIEGHQNCMKNGRSDTGFLYWRWNPRECKLPQMNPERFLELMRNKAWALIGDSISRNHVQSLICMLSKHKNADKKIGKGADGEEAIVYAKPEDEIFHQLSSWSISFPLHTQQVTANELKDYRPMCLVMAVDASKSSTFRKQLHSLIDES